MKRKFRRKFDDNPKSDPLGIGLSTKTLTLIGVGIVAAVALKMYLDRKKAAAASIVPQLPSSGGYVPAPGEVIRPPAGSVHVGVNGMGSRNPTSPSAVSPNGAGHSAGQMPQSPANRVEQSRAGYERSGGFSGMGDGMLEGGNSSL